MAQGIRTLAIAETIDSENPVLGDIKLENGDVVWLQADDPASTAQSIQRRLTFFLGEWFLDQNQGFPWFQEVLGKKSGSGKIKRLIRQAVLSTPGVRSVLSVGYAFDSETRHLDMEWQAVFDDGKVYSSADFAIPFRVKIA